MFNQKKLWIIEDDKDCQFIYELVLGLRYQLEVLNSLSAFSERLRTDVRPDLVIADIRLPDGNFLRMLEDRSVRQTLGVDVPLILVSDIDDIDALRYGFESGAVDYITKPFSKNELVVRVERILAREDRGERPVVAATVIDVDPVSHTVSFGALRSIPLTSKEFQIMAFLASASEMTASREEIQRQVWGQVMVSQNTLDVHMFNLRKKVRPLAIDISLTATGDYRVSCETP